MRLCLLPGCHHARPLCHGHFLREQRKLRGSQKRIYFGTRNIRFKGRHISSIFRRRNIMKKRTFQVRTKKLSHIQKIAKKITAPLSPKNLQSIF
ncbi:hypothetical protein BgiMline_010039 [Biomphalaria glabrata]